jgi:hypothetical protein
MCPRKIKYDPAVVPRQGFFGSPQFLGAFVVQVLPVNLWDFHHDQLGLDMISPMNRDFWVAISHHEPCFFFFKYLKLLKGFSKNGDAPFFPTKSPGAFNHPEPHRYILGCASQH